MSIFAAIALVGILVFIHEFGHFVFAKLFGVGVKEFAFGFGRRLFGFEHNGTDYRVCLLPIGGYVRMEGANPFMDGGEWDDNPDASTNFLKKPVWQRLIIVSAGPAFNLILPVVVFSLLYLGGEPQPAAVVGTVERGSVAEAAGLQPGDTLARVNGVPVTFWSDLYAELDELPATGSLSLGVSRAGQELQLALPLDGADTAGDGLTPGDLGLSDALADSTVGVDDPSSPAALAGLRSFDRVVRVGETPIKSYRDLAVALDGAGQSATVTWEREGEELTGTLLLKAGWQGPSAAVADPHANLWGLYPATLFVGGVTPDSAAKEGGLETGDRLLAIDGEPLGSWGEVTDRIGAKQVGDGRESSAVPVQLTLVRGGSLLEKQLTPRVTKDTDALGRYRYRAMIGIRTGGGLVGGPTARRYYPLPEAVKKGFGDTVAITGFVVEQVGKLFTGEADPSKTLGGPVQIFRDAARAAEEGIFYWARMMGGLSVSLAIINFLPVPVLDGGQFLFYAVEGIRGRPLSLAVRERAQQVGVLFLVALMLAVFVFDINRWLSS